MTNEDPHRRPSRKDTLWAAKQDYIPKRSLHLQEEQKLGVVGIMAVGTALQVVKQEAAVPIKLEIALKRMRIGTERSARSKK